jgi:opacity protein-like surface antigen
MSIRRIALLAIVVGSLLAAGASHADDFDRRGAYLGINAAYGIDLFTTEIANLAGVPPIPLTYDDSWGLNARLGYRALSWLALEVQYEWMKGIDVGLAGVNFATYKPHTLTGNLKLYLPVWRVQPYLLAGGGLAIYSLDFVGPLSVLNESGTGFGFRGGAGADVYLTKNLALNVEGTAVLNTSDLSLNQATFTQTNLYYFSISGGLLFRF